MNEQDWRPIATAPRNATEILIFGIYAHFPAMHVAQWRHNQWKVDTEDGFWGVDVKPTHWMPLPDRPDLLTQLEQATAPPPLYRSRDS